MHRVNTSKKITILGTLALSVSAVVLFAWFFQVKEILSIIPGSATMKFNTALLFQLSSIGVLTYSKSHKSTQVLNALLVFGILLIAAISLATYFFGVGINIDNLFIYDIYSTEYPGRMSPATAFCFMLLGISLWGTHASSRTMRVLTQYSLLVIILVSLVSIVAYALQIPGESRGFFIHSMAIHTSILFILLTLALSLKNPTLGFANLLFGKNAGSTLMRSLLPFLIGLPLLLSYILLKASTNNILGFEFGLSLHTVTFILISIVYTSIIATKLNKDDIKRSALEDSLRISNQELTFFKDALDQSSILATTDKKGVITSVNDKFCEISKYSREELIGKTHRVINSDFHPKEFFQTLWKTISSGNIWVGEVKNKAKDGSFYWMLTSIIPFKDDNGKINKYLSIRHDITDRKNGEERLAKQFEELKTKNVEIEQFAYIASHDLQEPLRTVINYTETLTEEYEGQLDSVADRYLSFIQDASKRMSELIKGLLDYSRLGKLTGRNQINCATILEEIKADLEASINETNTTITVGELPTVFGFEIELRLLFQNLITNAIKFRRTDIDPVITISAVKKELFWEFSVQDNGIGIEEKHIQKIFVIFQRLHSRKDFAGTGIGLSHCQKIVNLHGGTIWVKSEINKGSTFNFTIPIL